MNPHEAMQELERVVEMDDLGNLRLTGIPGLPLSRFVGPLGRISDQVDRATKPIPRDPAYWNAYHFAVRCYRTTYFGAPKKGRPPLQDKYLARLVELS